MPTREPAYAPARALVSIRRTAASKAVRHKNSIFFTDANVQQPGQGLGNADARVQRHPDVGIRASGPRPYTDALPDMLKNMMPGVAKQNVFVYIC